MHFLSIAILVLDPPRADWDFVKLFVQVNADTHTALIPGAASLPHLTAPGISECMLEDLLRPFAFFKYVCLTVPVEFCF